MPNSGPIQVAPPGFLGFLQLKNMGQNPSILPDTYQATIECRDWLFRGNQLYKTGTNTVATAGSGFLAMASGALAQPVPDGEWWYVHELNAECDALPAGDKLSIRAAYQDQVNSGLATTTIVGDVGRIDQVTTVITTPCSVARDFFVPPTTRLGLWVEWAQIAAGTPQISARVRYTPLTR